MPVETGEIIVNDEMSGECQNGECTPFVILWWIDLGLTDIIVFPEKPEI